MSECRFRQQKKLARRGIRNETWHGWMGVNFHQFSILDNSSIGCLVKACGMSPCQERLCSHDHTLCFHLHSCLSEAHLAGQAVELGHGGP